MNSDIIGYSFQQGVITRHHITNFYGGKVCVEKIFHFYHCPTSLVLYTLFSFSRADCYPDLKGNQRCEQ